VQQVVIKLHGIITQNITVLRIFTFRQAKEHMKSSILWLRDMRIRNRRDQSPAREYSYLHRTILAGSLEFIPTRHTDNQISSHVSVTHTPVRRQKFTHSDRIILRALKRQPTEAQDAEPNTTKKWRRNKTKKDKMKQGENRRLKGGGGRII
jgi:hypothetical protein